MQISVFDPSAALMRTTAGAFSRAEVDVAVFVRTQSIGKAESVRGDFPAFAGDQKIEQRQIATEIAFGVNLWLMLLFSPQPFQRIRKQRAAVVGVCDRILRPDRNERRSPCTSEMTPFADWPTTSFRKDCRCRHSCRQVDSNRLLFGLANQRRIHITASQISEAADRRQHLAKRIRAFPRDGPRADAARAGSADGSHVGIVGDAVFSFSPRE